MTLKDQIRAQLRIKRENFNREEYVLLDQEIAKSVESFLDSIIKENDIISFYWPMPGEPNLLPIFEKYKNRIVLPKLKGTWMDLCEFEGKEALEESDVKNLMQPKSNKKIVPDIVLVPGYGFSISGARVGAGKGHYDRYFSNNSDKKMIKIAVSFHENIYEYLPQETHDIKLDYVITDKKIIIT